MDDVLAEGVANRGGNPAFGDQNQQQLERIWGPVLEEDAKACGAVFGAASVLLRVAVDPVVLARFRALIPDHVKSQPGDTKEILKKRLGGSDWLDDINFKWKGHGGGGRTTKLNRTDMSQARRVTWSVMLGAATLFEGASVQVSSRPCTPMRRPHFFPSHYVASDFRSSLPTPSTDARPRTTVADRCLGTCTALAWHYGSWRIPS